MDKNTKAKPSKKEETEVIEENKPRLRIYKFFVVIFLLLVSCFLINIIPNYVVEEKTSKTSLILNNNNVTFSLKYPVIQKDGITYLSTKDLATYFDDEIYYEKDYETIITTSRDKVACFQFGYDTVNVNGESVKLGCKPLKEEIDGKEVFYLPLSKMEDIYNIEFYYNSEKNIASVDSKDRSLKTGAITKDSQIKYKATPFSATVDEVKQGEDVFVVLNDNKTETTINGYTKVRSPKGVIGYVKDLGNISTKREDYVEKKQIEGKVSMFWDYVSENGQIAKRSGHVQGVNVVSPTFLSLVSEKKGELNVNMANTGDDYIKWAHEQGYKIWVCFTNNSHKLTTQEIIKDYNVRTSLINNVINYLNTYDVDGLNVDFENISPEYKEQFSRFIIELAPRVRALNKVISVDVTAPDGGEDWSLFADRRTLGKAVDYVFLMAYDENNGAVKTPGSTASLNWVKVALNKMQKKDSDNYVPKEKLVLGIPFYSWFYKINSNGELFDAEAIEMKNYSKVIPESYSTEWDDDKKQNKVTYVKNGYNVVTWIEDTKSLGAKLDLIKEYDLIGAAYCVKDEETNDVWQIVNEKIGIK